MQKSLLGYKEKMIYFLEAENGLIKIGYTTCKNGKRFKNIRNTSPVAVQLIGLLDDKNGGRKLEHKIHRNFDIYRHHGEWFRGKVIKPIIKKAMRATDVNVLLKFDTNAQVRFEKKPKKRFVIF